MLAKVILAWISILSGSTKLCSTIIMCLLCTTENCYWTKHLQTTPDGFSTDNQTSSNEHILMSDLKKRRELGKQIYSIWGRTYKTRGYGCWRAWQNLRTIRFKDHQKVRIGEEWGWRNWQRTWTNCTNWNIRQVRNVKLCYWFTKSPRIMIKAVTQHVV